MVICVIFNCFFLLLLGCWKEIVLRNGIYCYFIYGNKIFLKFWGKNICILGCCWGD